MTQYQARGLSVKGYSEWVSCLVPKFVVSLHR